MYETPADRTEKSTWERYEAEDAHAGLTTDGIEALLDAEGVQDDEICSTLFTLAGYKEGTFIDWNDTDGYDRFVDAVNTMGGTVYTWETDGIYGGKTLLLITRDDRYDPDAVADVMGSGSDRDAWLGTFLGFPSDDVAAWTDPARETATTKQLVQRYGDHLSAEDREDVERFNYGTFADTPTGMERATRRARTRRNAFEALQAAYDVDLEPLLEDGDEEAQGLYRDAVQRMTVRAPARYDPEDM